MDVKQANEVIQDRTASLPQRLTAHEIWAENESRNGLPGFFKADAARGADICAALRILLVRTEPKPEAPFAARIGNSFIINCVAPTGPGWYVVLRPDDAVPTIVRVDSVSATELRVWRHGNINGAPLKGYTFFARIEL